MDRVLAEFVRGELDLGHANHHTVNLVIDFANARLVALFVAEQGVDAAEFAEKSAHFVLVFRVVQQFVDVGHGAAAGAAGLVPQNAEIWPLDFSLFNFLSNTSVNFLAEFEGFQPVGGVLHGFVDNIIDFLDAVVVAVVVAENLENETDFFQKRASFVLVVWVGQHRVNFAHVSVAGVANFFSQVAFLLRFADMDFLAEFVGFQAVDGAGQKLVHDVIGFNQAVLILLGVNELHHNAETFQESAGVLLGFGIGQHRVDFADHRVAAIAGLFPPGVPID